MTTVSNGVLLGTLYAKSKECSNPVSTTETEVTETFFSTPGLKDALSLFAWEKFLLELLTLSVFLNLSVSCNFE